MFNVSVGVSTGVGNVDDGGVEVKFGSVNGEVLNLPIGVAVDTIAAVVSIGIENDSTGVVARVETSIDDEGTVGLGWISVWDDAKGIMVSRGVLLLLSSPRLFIGNNARSTFVSNDVNFVS